MGMQLIGCRLTPGELRAVLEDPAVVSALLFGDLEDEDAEMPEPELDLDKSWHGIHYLLTGTAWESGDGPAGAAVLGGEPIGEDTGYGPPRLLRPEEVSAIAAALDAVDIDTLRARYDPDAMKAADIYPDIWSLDDADFDTYLAPYFTELRRFYGAAAAGRQAVLLALA